MPLISDHHQTSGDLWIHPGALFTINLTNAKIQRFLETSISFFWNSLEVVFLVRVNTPFLIMFAKFFHKFRQFN